MENYLRMIELELIIHQKDYELSVKDAALAVKNKEIEEKNNTIKQLTEELQLLYSQYHDTIMELRDKLRVKDDKIKELSTKLAEVIVGNLKHDDEEKLKDRLSPTSDKAVSKGPDKMPDYEGFRKIADEAQRKMIEEQKKWDSEKINNINRKLSIPAFKLPDDYVKGIWETFFNE